MEATIQSFRQRQTEELAAIQRATAQGVNVWSMCVSAGIAWREDEDFRKFGIGELAKTVTKEYGKNRVAEFAKAISEKVTAVTEYRTMARFYENSAWAEILEELPLLGYTHLRVAKRLKKLDAAREFLLECADGEWTVEKAGIELDKRLGKPEPPLKLLDAIATVRQIETHDPNGAVIVLQCAPGVDAFALEAIDGKTVRLVVWEESDAS